MRKLLPLAFLTASRFTFMLSSQHYLKNRFILSWRIGRTAFFALLAACFSPLPVLAYIDPGTGNVVFSSLGYLIAIGIMVGGILLLPFKKLYSFFKKKRSAGKNNDDNPA